MAASSPIGEQRARADGSVPCRCGGRFGGAGTYCCPTKAEESNSNVAVSVSDCQAEIRPRSSTLIVHADNGDTFLVVRLADELAEWSEKGGIEQFCVAMVDFTLPPETPGVDISLDDQLIDTVGPHSASDTFPITLNPNMKSRWLLLAEGNRRPEATYSSVFCCSQSITTAAGPPSAHSVAASPAADLRTDECPQRP